jgi:cytochrome c biogenesis protein CcmG/thiol:disulfide interchange protein DsbE
LPSTIQQVHGEYGPRGLTVLAINIEEDGATVARWVAQKKVTFTILLDPTGAANRAWHVTGTPTVFVVGRDGTLVGKAFSTKAWTGPVGRALLRALLAR